MMNINPAVVTPDVGASDRRSRDRPVSGEEQSRYFITDAWHSAFPGIRRIRHQISGERSPWVFDDLCAA
jgi:hypothetical protein